MPMLVSLSEETGEKQYLEAAERAGEYLWKNYGSQGGLCRGTTDNPKYCDKEAGMLALEAYSDAVRGDEGREVAGAREGGGGLCGELDLDLERADAGGCGRCGVAMEAGRADSRRAGDIARGAWGRGRVFGVGGALLFAAVQGHQ